MKTNKKGKFIIFEGLDKTGKTTQLNLVKEQLQKKGYDKVYITFEPGDSHIGSYLREILLNASLDISNLTEFFLFISDRLEHSMKNIIKYLDNDYIVIVDRFHFSTFAYQVFPAMNKITKKEYKDKQEINTLKTLIKMDKIFGKYLFSMVDPDLIFYFYNDRYFIKNRINKNLKLMKEDRFESRGESFLKIVLTGYDKSFSYYKNYKKIVHKIPFSKGIEKNRNFICNKILDIL